MVIIAIDLSMVKKLVKDSEIVPYPLCLRNISKDFSPLNTLKTELVVCVYDFSVDYWAIANEKILDIHKYLMKKHNIVKNVWIYKMFFHSNNFFLVTIH